MRRMKRSQVPQVLLSLLKHQGGKCGICGEPCGPGKVKTAALDHDHDTGHVRGVLCINCNGIEGKIRSLVRRMGRHLDKHTAIRAISAYWLEHKEPKFGGVFHWTHKTEDEKRLERNKKAAAVRKKAKEQK